MRNINKIGDTATYIEDYDFEHLFEIPKEVALEWIKQKCPETNMGNLHKAKELTLSSKDQNGITKNGWLNKLFVIIGGDHGIKYAITNWDGKFSLYSSKIEN